MQAQYNNNPDSFPVKAHRFFESIPVLNQVGEVFIPVRTNQKRYQDTRDELDRTEKEKNRELNKLEEERRLLETQENAALLALRDILEARVVRSELTVLGYAVSYPQRRHDVFHIYSQKTDNPLATVQYLNEKYAELTGEKLETKGRLHVSYPSTMTPSVRKADREIRPEKRSEPPKEDQKKPEYKIGMVDKVLYGKRSFIRLLTGAEVGEYFKKRAEELASSDERMLKDINTIISSVQNDPYGPGTKKLRAMRVTIGLKGFPLRSFNPIGRTGLVFLHPESGPLRVVYTLAKEGEQNVIVLEGIYTHEEYDKKFSR